jgi:hypothetical protein
MADLKQAKIAKTHLSGLYLSGTAAAAWSWRPEVGVVAVGVGYWAPDGKRTNEACVRMYVEPSVLESAKRRLPEKEHGVRIQILPSAPFRTLLDVPHRQRLRPARPGCSIGFRAADSINAGTLGAIVEKAGKRHILSNNHVLADMNRLAIGAEIVQPGTLDDATAETIARLSQFIQLKAGELNELDCAIAEVIDPSLVTAEFLAPIGRLLSAAPVSADEGTVVEKIGQGSFHTVGEVYDTSFDVRVDYGGLGILTFRDQLAVRRSGQSFGQPGDSGALVVHQELKRPVGLLFGGSPQFTIVTPIGRVLDALEIGLII